MQGLSAAGEPRIAYGFWRYGAGDVDAAVAALEVVRAAGVDHLDTADVYGGPEGFGGAETLLGTVRKRAPSLFEGASIATKAGVEIGTPYNSSRDYLVRACEASLARMGVERVDLFYVHRHDLTAHPEEVAGALDALVRAGKAAAVAVSNYTPSQVSALKRFLKAPLAAHQVEFSPDCLAPAFDGTFDQCMGEGIAAVAWSPLAGGRLGVETPDDDIAAVCKALDAIGARYGLLREAVAIAFILAHPACVTPILGTRTLSRIEACLAGRALKLTRREWYDIVEARRGARMP